MAFLIGLSIFLVLKYFIFGETEERPGTQNKEGDEKKSAIMHKTEDESESAQEQPKPGLRERWGRFSADLKAWWRLRRASRHQQYAFKYLTEAVNNLNYSCWSNAEKMQIRLEVDFPNNNSGQFNLTVSAQQIYFESQLSRPLNPDKIREVMVLAAHINNIAKVAQVSVYPQHQLLLLNFKVDVLRAVYSPELLPILLHNFMRDTYFVSDNLHLLEESDEDPVFVITEVVKRWSEKSE